MTDTQKIRGGIVMKWFKNRLKKKEVPEVEEYNLKDTEVAKLSESFVSGDEKYIASLGNGYIMNVLANKSVKKGFAFITDKRVYFKGSCLNGTGKRLVKTNEERTVDIKNITGSGFTSQRYWGVLIALLVSIIVALTFAVFFFSNGRSLIINDEDATEMNQKFKNANKLLYSLYGVDDMDFSFEMGTDEGGTERGVIKVIVHNDDTVEITGSIYPSSLRLHIVTWEDGFRDREIIYADSSTNKTILNDFQKCKTNEELIKIFEKIFSKKEVYSEYTPSLLLAGLTSIVLPLAFLLLAIILCIGFIKNYLFRRKTLFRIEYAGGCIAFNASFYAKKEIEDFQKQLRKAKDMAEENTNIKAVAAIDTPVEATSQNKNVDALRKYAELLKDGLITQEEYDAMKKKVLGL